jgi:hypothetical protein
MKSTIVNMLLAIGIVGACVFPYIDIVLVIAVSMSFVILIAYYRDEKIPLISLSIVLIGGIVLLLCKLLFSFEYSVLLHYYISFLGPVGLVYRKRVKAFRLNAIFERRKNK